VDECKPLVPGAHVHGRGAAPRHLSGQLSLAPIGPVLAFWSPEWTEAWPYWRLEFWRRERAEVWLERSGVFEIRGPAWTGVWVDWQCWEGVEGWEGEMGGKGASHNRRCAGGGAPPFSLPRGA